MNMSRLICNSFVIGLVALLACDRPGIVEPRALVTYRADVDAHVTGTRR
jgi:hypothetical protein